MTVDLKLLGESLKQAKEQKSLDYSVVSPYLMQRLFVPYMQGADIRLDSLDYDKFDLSDMDMLFTFIKDIEAVQSDAEYIPRNLRKCDPAAKTARAFC